MNGLVLFILVLVLVIILITWVIPKLLAWVFERKYKLVLRIGCISLPYFRLCDVNISKKGFNIHIEEIGIRSSFFSASLTKLITIVIKDVRINKDIGATSTEQDVIENLPPRTRQALDFRDKKIPSSITNFAQFMAVHIYNISAMFLRSETPGWLIHANASELHLDGSIVQNSRILLVNANLREASTKVLRHAEVRKSEDKTVLGELTFAIEVEASFIAQGPLSFERMTIGMCQTSATINDGFYDLLAQETNVKAASPEQYYDYCESNFNFYKIAPVVPKQVVLKIDDTSLRSVRENSRTDFNCSLQALEFNYKISSLNARTAGHKNVPQVTSALKLCELVIQNSREKILVLKKIKLDTKFDNYNLNIGLAIHTLIITYTHEVIHTWVHNNFLTKAKSPLQVKTTNAVACNAKKPNLLERLLKQCIVKGVWEMNSVSALFKMNGNHSTIGFSHSKLFLEQVSETRSFSYNSYLPKLLLANRHWQIEVLVESLWWSFNEWIEPPAVPKKVHVWETPVFLGMGLVKFSTYGNMELKIEALFDSFQIEWRPKMADYITSAIQSFQQYGMRASKTQQIAEKTQEIPTTIIIAANYLNVFFLTQNNEYLTVRLDTFTLEKSFDTTNLQLKCFKFYSIASGDNFYRCIACDDIRNYLYSVKLIKLDMKTGWIDNVINVKIDEPIEGCYSTNLHMKVLSLYEQFNKFVSNIRTILNIQSKNKERNSISKTKYSIKIVEYLKFHIQISDKHYADLLLVDINASTSDDGASLSAEKTVIAIDGDDIFTIKGILLNRVADNKMIKEERLDNENFVLPWNKTWGISIQSFKAIFPYEHEYAEAVQNEFVSLFKWIKKIHNIKKAPFTANSPLPSDLLINIKEFMFEMSDDPFEVRLRDNFELLEDEFNENIKRLKSLKEKLATMMHLPATKVEELYAKLNKKNAEIYLQRSRKMKSLPPRTRLFAWNMNEVEIMVLADPSIHGTDNVINTMQEIDAESPWPEEGIEFSTLWCRVVSLRCHEWKFQLRDFPQPLLYIREFYICGQLIGAEQVAPRRAKREVKINLGEPFGFDIVERSMLPLKFYHDFNCEIEYYSYAFGPCWEPVIAQCNLSFEKISAPSRDPSPPLSFWDKMRLLLHGRLTMVVQQLTVLLHASLDPYNTTEEMECTWNQVIMDWTNAKFVYKGDLNIFVRTASKYDDCQLLHLPNLKLIVNIQWLCLGDPNDHHNVIQCAPDKVPEYSSNQVHDSFRAFRSQNVNLSIVLETRPIPNQSPTNAFDCPTLSLYGSTLRWFENLKLILSGVTRPTGRGKIFNNLRPRKIQLSRHYKKIHLLMGLHKFKVCYWMSFAMQRGCELLGGRLSSSSEHTLSLVSVDDGLKHRPKAEWSIMYMNSELNDSEIWLKSALQEDPEREAMSLRQPVEKWFCLSVAKVSYGREAVLPNRELSAERNKDTPTHRLVVYDLKGAWTKNNRNVAFALFDTFMKNKQMKKNLSTEALKGFRKETSTTPLKRRNTEAPGTPPNVQTLQTSSVVQDTPSPLSKLQSGHAATMLQQLIAEAENKNVVFSDDLSSATRQQHLQGLQACQEDDVQHKNWLIALVNAQVLLKGCETKGYVILSAAKAEILQRIHRPVWKDRTLVSKTTWVGTLECLQYYATVNAGENDAINENIMWLTVDNIQEKESTVISEIPQIPNMVGSGVSVGAVVSDTVGASGVENSPIQLQRIVSRCKCEFFYVGYGDISVDPATVSEVPQPPQEDVGPWERRQTAVDAFTLMHHDLDVCTNSLQYTMLLDIVNNLLLYVEPHRKKALEKLARMRFQLQLHSVEDQRRPIQNLQTQVRSAVSRLRRLEKETHFVSKALAENPNDVELIQEMEKLENLVYECKTQLNAQSEELDMMLSCYKESQLLAHSRLATLHNDKPLTIVRANEICFKHAQWRLTETDGQLGIADLVLSNFLYTKNSKSDDSVEHLLELGYLRMTNLLKNQVYTDVLCPTEIQSNMPVEHKRVVRLYCREKPPVGGISVKEHFEINVVPLTIALTKKFYNTMLKFCFPERDPENIEGERGEEIDSESRNKKSRSSGRKSRDSNFYVHIDDVEKMKERAEKNKLFIYIKIPEVPVRLSYKGNKEKNLEDIRDFSLVIPTLEYHNVTWTWLDLLMAIRSDSRKVILSQAIKQKLQIKRNIGSSDESSSPHEEDKAKILFGNRHAPENKSTKKGVGSVFKFGK